jgi:predicted O-methyltransferase YrrM
MIYNKTHENAILQHPQEAAEFMAFLKEKNVRSYLEIGSWFGGSLWHFVRTMPKGSRAVAVDWPNADGSRHQPLPQLQSCVNKLNGLGYDVRLLLGDSADKTIIEKVVSLAPFDLVFIDGNHSAAYVHKDFNNYGRMASIVCFHDIAWNENGPASKMPCQVSQVWNEFKQTYKDRADFIEILHGKDAYGIGILQWKTT